MINSFGQIDASKFDLEKSLQSYERMDCENSLYEFFQKAWKYIDASPYTDGWPIEAVAEHLQAVVDGDIKRLIINIPPRCAKSTMTSVAFPAWVWCQPWDSPTSGPGVQLLHASYASSLALRDSVKCRKLIESPWYQQLWGDRFQLQGDQNTKGRFANDKNGERLITAVEARVTGEGGNIIVIDDPNAANEAYSEASIRTTVEWWDTTMSTRLNNPKTGAFIVIQQRLSEEDMTGHIMSKEFDNWTHLCLPMRYEWQRHSYTKIGWHDPRGCGANDIPLIAINDDGERIPVSQDAKEELDRREGMLLWPERFAEAEVNLLEKQLGPWSAAGQLQQRPEPKGGGIIKRDWWQTWEHVAYPPMEFVVASLDTAYTTKTTNDFSALTVWGVFTSDVIAQSNRSAGRFSGITQSYERTFAESHPRVFLMYAFQERLEIHELVKKVAHWCKELKVDVLLIENKAAGHSVAQEIRRLYGFENFGVQLYDPKSQDKLSRLYSIQHLFAEGMIYAPIKAWSEMVISQVGTFPKGKHDDLVDTVSMALRHMRDIGVLVRSEEWAHTMEENMTFKGNTDGPLYPV
jgi:predicted phage terminase large subunit-like protein